MLTNLSLLALWIVLLWAFLKTRSDIERLGNRVDDLLREIEELRKQKQTS